MTDGPFAWLMVIVALLLIFGGGKRLPEIGRGLGAFIKEFKKAQSDDAPVKVDPAASPEKLPPKDDQAPQA